MNVPINTRARATSFRGSNVWVQMHPSIHFSFLDATIKKTGRSLEHFFLVHGCVTGESGRTTAARRRVSLSQRVRHRRERGVCRRGARRVRQINEQNDAKERGGGVYEALLGVCVSRRVAAERSGRVDAACAFLEEFDTGGTPDSDGPRAQGSIETTRRTRAGGVVVVGSLSLGRRTSLEGVRNETREFEADPSRGDTQKKRLSWGVGVRGMSTPKGVAERTAS